MMRNVSVVYDQQSTLRRRLDILAVVHCMAHLAECAGAVPVANSIRLLFFLSSCIEVQESVTLTFD